MTNAQKAWRSILRHGLDDLERKALTSFSFASAGWVIPPQVDCFGPQATIQPPGMIEIKAEELRAVVCATPDLLQDASFSVENWVIRKSQRAFRNKLSQAVMCGDGMGKPVGILHPNSGIPICDVPNNMPVSERNLTNGRTLGLVMTMSDAMGRPIWLYPTPAPNAGGFTGFQIGQSGSGRVVDSGLCGWRDADFVW